MAISRAAPLLLIILLAATAAKPTQSLSSYQFKTLLSLSNSLLTRVANLRASRGDTEGYYRAKTLAEKLQLSSRLGVIGAAWSLGWDYVWNYAWRDFDYGELYGVVADLNELGRLLGELNRSESAAAKAEWAARNYGSAFQLSERVCRRLLLKVFQRSGPLRQVLETFQKEVVEGGLLKDCLELGSGDMGGLVQILKDLALQFSSSNQSSEL